MTREQLDRARRTFLTRLGAGAAAFGAAFSGGATAEAAQAARAASSGPAERWQPARHAEDDWFDQTAAKHRLFFDTTTPAALGQAIFFASNFFTGNKNGYGLADTDLAVVVCVRHQSTVFAFSDAMWAKYGASFSQRAASFVDPTSKEVPVANVYQSAAYGAALPNNGVTLDAVTKRGLRLAVCQLSTRASANLIAQKTGASADAVYKELTEHLVPNAHMVPAGIVAVNRAQERGYSFAYAT